MLQLEKQAEGITGNLDKLYAPFTGSAWTADETDPKTSWIPWEVRAYWCDGALRCGVLLQNDAVRAQAMRLLDFTFNHAQSDGYLGPAFLKAPGSYHRWPHTVFFRAAMAWYESSGDSTVVERLSRHYLGENYAFVGWREQTNIEAMLWTYKRTGNPKLLRLAERTWAMSQAELAKATKDWDLTGHGMLTPGPVRSMHGVSYAEHSKLPALLYLETGDRNYLDLSISAYRKIVEHHMLVDGGPSSSEFLSTTTARDGHETCDLIDYPWDWGYMLAATRDGAYGDLIERTTFNALPGALRKDWKALQYFSSPNQILCTSSSDHLAVLKGLPVATIRKYRYMQRMSYRPSPGYSVVCCPANVNRALPNYVGRMWMVDPEENGLAATLYGPCEATAKVSARRLPVTITEETSYPYSEEISFRLSMSEGISFPLHLRIPSWAVGANLRINGSDLPMPALNSGFITVRRHWQSGDTLLLRLPMTVNTSEWPEDGMALERGPLVYAYSIPEKWTEVQDERSSPSFPAWDVTPTGAWNYSLLADTAARCTATSVRDLKDPWSTAPSTLAVSARFVENWKAAETIVDRESVTFTPRLPDASVLPTRLTGPVQQLTLVPYGNTELRIAIFPHLKTDPGPMPGD